jgi:hypothetical protein
MLKKVITQKTAQETIVTTIATRPPCVEKFIAVVIVPGPARIDMARVVTATLEVVSRHLFDLQKSDCQRARNILFNFSDEPFVVLDILTLNLQSYRGFIL